MTVRPFTKPAALCGKSSRARCGSGPPQAGWGWKSPSGWAHETGGTAEGPYWRYRKYERYFREVTFNTVFFEAVSKLKFLPWSGGAGWTPPRWTP